MLYDAFALHCKRDDRQISGDAGCGAEFLVSSYLGGLPISLGRVYFNIHDNQQSSNETMVGSKKDKQREQTHQNLIETAERLFAENGIAAVSLRQIGMEAGSLNTNVVGFYFGTKEALIDAIYNYRLPLIEQYRAKIIADLDQNGLGHDYAELLRATWLPLQEIKDKNGNHSYARFLLSVQRAGLGWTRNVLNEQYPVASEIYRRLRSISTDMQIANPDFKLTMQINMMAWAFEYIDERKLSRADAKALFDDAIRMTCAALLAQDRGK